MVQTRFRSVRPLRLWLLGRPVLRLVLTGLLSSLAGTMASAQPTTPAAAAPIDVEQVQPGVFVHRGKLEDWGPQNAGDVANLGFIVGSRCVAVIDTGGTPAVGRALRAAVVQQTALPICYVINTHAHPDHLLGDVAFQDTAGQAPKQFVAASSYRHSLAVRAPYYLNALARDFGIELPPAAIVFPDVDVDQTRQLDLGNRLLTLRAWSTAHTDNDLTVQDEQTRTLFAGDLLFVLHIPALDGSLRGWIDVTRALAKLDVATVVPGHGAVSNDWPAVLAPQLGYLSGLLRATRDAIHRNWTIGEATERIAVPNDEHWLLADRFHRRNVTAAFAELEWEDDSAASVPETGPAPALGLPNVPAAGAGVPAAR